MFKVIFHYFCIYLYDLLTLDSENLPTTHVSQPKTDKKSHVHHHNQTPLKPTPPLNISNVTHQQIQPNLSNPAPNTNTGQILLLVQLPNGTQIPLPVTPAVFIIVYFIF